MPSAISDSTTTSGFSALATTGNNKLGKNEFLKLLLEQLKGQDPTDPVDNSAMVAQLAQFSQLEQLQSSNDTLQSLLLAQNNTNQTASAAFLGRDVRYRASTLELAAPGQPGSFSVELPAAAQQVTARLLDGQGRTVKTLTLGESSGRVTFSWDGKDEAGAQAPPGVYTVQVAATGRDGQALAVEATGQGRVTGITFEKGYAQLLLNGSRINLTNVVDLKEVTPPTQGSTP